MNATLSCYLRGFSCSISYGYLHNFFQYTDINRYGHGLGRARLRSLRESLATRRRTLSQARLLSLTSASSATHQSNPTSPSSTPVPSNTVLDAQISRELQQLSLLSDTLARARSGLVSELVEVFNIVEVGGRPPIGRKAGIKGEWTIEGLVLPVPGDIRRELLSS